MTKRLTALLLAAMLLVSLAACGGKTTPDKNDASRSSSNASSSSADKVKLDSHPASELEITMVWNLFSGEENAKFSNLRFYGWKIGEYVTADGDSGVFYWEMPEDGKMTYKIKEGDEWVEHTWTLEIESPMLALTDGDTTTIYEGVFPPKYMDEMCGIYEGDNGGKLALCPDGYGYFLNSYDIIMYIKWSMEDGMFSFSQYGEPRESTKLSDQSYAYTADGESFTLTESGVTYKRTVKLDVG